MSAIYIETAIQHHPRVAKILARLPDYLPRIDCQHYGDVFNAKAQSFRVQKQQPAYILAAQRGRRVHNTPEQLGIGGQHNFYFSHMFNCLYDCRYCFLQGLYPSAHYLIFVNDDDFMTDIRHTIAQHADAPCFFFSGYDCDSLAMEPITGFAETFLPFFRELEGATLELRTKSTNIRVLLSQPAFHRCVVAFSFTPDHLSRAIEHKVPSVEKRIAAMQKVAEHGWPIGIRLDPLIYCDQFESLYTALIDTLFTPIICQQLHSVSIGPLRFPHHMYDKIKRLYPESLLMAHPLYKRPRYHSYDATLEQRMHQQVVNAVSAYVDRKKIFQCHQF